MSSNGKYSSSKPSRSSGTVKIKEEPQSPSPKRKRERSRSPDERGHRGSNIHHRHHRDDDRKRHRNEEDDSRKEKRRFSPDERRNPRKSFVDRREKVDDGQFEWGKPQVKEEKTDEEAKPKEKPNFGLSGNLAKDTNLFNGVVIKYNEPPEARKPKLRWRLYPFKGEEALDFIPVHRQSAYLLGRDRRIADIPVDHPSCSKQHAVLQFRLIKKTLDNGSVSRRVRPYVIDLGSANGTFVNNKQIDAQRYYELFEKDVIKFGFSSREYVLLHENSQDELEAEAEDANEEGAVNSEQIPAT